ncbi:MAG: hypothetical protein QGG38_09525 [Nitrospinaceae bacterium]|jgi:predicted membrane protein|nr:hypothetical protein [Nitrospinaceae bacterium]HAK37834.1 hypothetical protein [Nitrospina sp.]|tara:strand:+ start:1625 stop:1849 length:225 start_codon:yes stop_codon:yes gene_type:complete
MILRFFREQKESIFSFILIIIVLEVFVGIVDENLIIWLGLAFIANLILVNQRKKKKEEAEKLISMKKPSSIEPE